MDFDIISIVLDLLSLILVRVRVKDLVRYAEERGWRTAAVGLRVFSWITFLNEI